MVDEEFEKLKQAGRRHLPLMGSGAHKEVGAFKLEGPGRAPAPSPSGEGALRSSVIEALKTVRDPEIPLDLYSLGLIYEILIDAERHVLVRMTLTAPGCPVAGTLVGQVHDRVCGVAGVTHATTELVWDPPWSRERMSDAARLALGLL